MLRRDDIDCEDHGCIVLGKAIPLILVIWRTCQEHIRSPAIITWATRIASHQVLVPELLHFVGCLGTLGSSGQDIFQPQRLMLKINVRKDENRCASQTIVDINLRKYSGQAKSQSGGIPRKLIPKQNEY